MIDWLKERTSKNYCGWCDDTPTSGSCNGACFKEHKNRVDHSIEMIKLIPNEIKKLKEKEKYYKDFLSNLDITFQH